jgi:hypothetical protein
VDVVEVVGGPGPLELCVVYEELAVGRHPPWLDGGDVRADDLGGGELVGEVSGG